MFFSWCEGGYTRRKRQESGELTPSPSRQVEPTRPTRGWRTAWRTVTRAVECPKCGRLQPPSDACQDPECAHEIKGIKSPLAGLRFHDLRHCAITKPAESQASDQTIMSIAGHVSRAMLEHYSHFGWLPSALPWTPFQHPCRTLRPVENLQIFRVMCTKIVTKPEMLKMEAFLSY